MGNELFHDLLDPGFLNVFLAIMAAGLLLGGLFHGLAQLHARHAEDDQIVLKVTLQYFQSLGVLAIVSGLSKFAAELWNEGRDLGLFTTNTRDSLALFLGGGVVALFHGLVLRHGTSQASRLSVRRYFLGWRLGVHGFVIVAAVLAAFLLFIQRDPRDWPRRAELRETQVACFGVLFTWGLSWLAHVLLLWWVSSRPAPPGATWEGRD